MGSSSRKTVLAAISLMFFSACLLQILACALYNNWWPMLTVLMYIMVPIPCLFVENGSADFITSGDAGDWADAAKFLAGFSGIGSIAIPSILCHTGLIQVGSMCMVFTSTFILFCAVILFTSFTAEDEW